MTVANSTGGVILIAGIGLNSTTTFDTGNLTGGAITTAAAAASTLVARYVAFPAVGYNFYSWNEYSTATGTTTWYGVPSGTSANGIQGWIQG
jgi:hypothetical protein